MPTGCEAVSPIRRPRVFARALGAMAAEQVGPRGQTVLLRSTVDEQAFCTAHRSQVVYHGPVVYADDPIRRLERASSDLELLLLVMFLKNAAHRAQREYRFAVWAEEESEEDRVDFRISPALVDAMQRLQPEPAASGVVPAGKEAAAATQALDEVSLWSERVEALPVLARPHNSAAAPRRHEVRRLPGEPTTVATALDALQDAVAKVDAACRKDAAAAWHAEPIVRFLCSSFGDGLDGVRVSDDNLIVITGTLPGDSPGEARIAVGPEGNCACRISVGDTHLASTAQDARSFERILKSRMPEVGAHGPGRYDLRLSLCTPRRCEERGWSAFGLALARLPPPTRGQPSCSGRAGRWESENGGPRRKAVPSGETATATDACVTTGASLLLPCLYSAGRRPYHVALDAQKPPAVANARHAATWPPA